MIHRHTKSPSGGKYVSPSLAESLALNLGDDNGKPLHNKLSSREYQILCMIASGKNRKRDRIRTQSERKNGQYLPGTGPLKRWDAFKRRTNSLRASKRARLLTQTTGHYLNLLQPISIRILHYWTNGLSDVRFLYVGRAFRNWKLGI